ncbi:MAG: SDR family oxidoreductase [Holophagales bacterium]|nr:MAG: SDR family oxidoreductase [Holophagales bacterium]
MTGRTVLVTGAGSGIGAAAARCLAAAGASVLCTDRDDAAAARTAAALPPAIDHPAPRRLDVTSETEWEAAVGSLASLDAIVHSAGVSAASALDATSLAAWRELLAVNLDGAFLAVRSGFRAMSGRGGSIVLVASASGLRAASGAAAYSVSKAAVCMLAKAAAKESRDRGLGVRVNTVCPAGVKTPLWEAMPFFRELVAKTGSTEAAYRELAGGTPGGRFAEPEEIAQAILYLASDTSAFVTGIDLPLDGGYLL